MSWRRSPPKQRRSLYESSASNCCVRRHVRKGAPSHRSAIAFRESRNDERGLYPRRERRNCRGGRTARSAYFTASELALSRLARRGSVAASHRLAKPLNLLNPSPAVRQVMSIKTPDVTMPRKGIWLLRASRESDFRLRTVSSIDNAMRWADAECGDEIRRPGQITRAPIVAYRLEDRLMPPALRRAAWDITSPRTGSS